MSDKPTEDLVQHIASMFDIPTQQATGVSAEQVRATIAIFQDSIQEQIQPSPKKSRGLGKRTIRLRDAIIDAFDQTSKPVTVRQMFYMLSVRSAVDKTEGGYGQVQRQLLAMRRDGSVPYDWIADNTRWMRKPTTYESLSDFFDRSVRFYRQDLWVKSDTYVEVWCEKDALAGVLYEETEQWHVPLMVSRGYSSESFAYAAAENIQELGKPGCIYYLGDFDPSGWHMAEDLHEKLLNFGANIEFHRLAVGPEQVREWDLPSRPTKKSDTRSKEFYRRFGHNTPSVELDAIPPDMLRKLVRDAITNHVDPEQLRALELEERHAREVLRQMSEAYGV